MDHYLAYVITSFLILTVGSFLFPSVSRNGCKKRDDCIKKIDKQIKGE